MTNVEYGRVDGEVRLPGGWLLRTRDDLEPEAVDIQGPSCPRTVLTGGSTEPHSRILHALLRDMLVRQLRPQQG